MAFITFSDKYIVGVKEIDDQHKELFNFINSFYDNLQIGDNKALGDLLSSLAEYTMFHFRTEEKYFDEFGYLNSKIHKREHQIFTDKVLDVKKNYDSGKVVISLDITNFLKKWLAGHISHSDKKYRKCFHDNGLS